MLIIDLALKDLSQLVRDWKSALFLVAMPVAFTLLFGFVFSGTGGQEDPRLPVGFLDEDGGAVLSVHLLDLLASSDAIRPIVLEDTAREEAQQQVEDEDLAAVVIVPAGYSATILALSDTKRQVPVLLVDEDSSAGTTALTGVQAAVARLLGAVQAASLSVQAVEARGGTTSAALLEKALDQAVESWLDPPLTTTASQPGGAVQEEGSRVEVNRFAHSSAGIMVQFAIAGLIGSASILVLERKSGALRRLLTTPISRAEIILGHFLAMFVMVLLQLVILVAFGQLALGVPYMQAPAATLLMVLVTALWSASLGMVIGVVAKTDEQVIILSLVLMMILAGLGGAWMPLEFTSQAFQTVGHLMPTAWAIDGFENIVVRGLGLESVLTPVAILLAFTAVLLVIGVWRFRFE